MLAWPSIDSGPIHSEVLTAKVAVQGYFPLV
jgi:hypothetical protein